MIRRAASLCVMACVAFVAGCGSKATAPEIVAVPTLTAITPSSIIAGSTATVTLTGTNFTGGATVAISGAGLTLTNVSVTSATSISLTVAAAANADISARNVSVTTASGTTAAQTFTVNPTPPTVVTSSVSSVTPGGNSRVTVTGSGFVAGLTTVTVSGDGVTVSDIVVSGASGSAVGGVFHPEAAGTSTSLSFTLTIAANATPGTRTLTIATPGGASASTTFSIADVTPGIASFTVSHLTADLGETLTLAWSAAPSTTCSIDNGVGNVSCAGGQVSVSPRATTTYTLTARSAGGATVTRSLTVTVVDPSLPPVIPAGAFTITIYSRIILHWLPVAADRCSIDTGFETVQVPCGGGDLVVLHGHYEYFSNFTFVFTATNRNGSSTATAFYDVESLIRPSVLSFEPRFASVFPNRDLILSWRAVGRECSLDHGIGVVPCEGSRAVRITADTSYTLTATETRTGESTSTSSVFYVIVPPDITYFEHFETTAAGVDRFRWNVREAITCHLTSVGTVPCNGSRDLELDAPTDVTLSATSLGGGVERTIAIRNTKRRFEYNGTTGADGSPQSFTVPAGVTSLTVYAIGAKGGNGGGGSVGGGAQGAVMGSVISVTPGEVLTIRVGGQGGSGTGRGGYNGGGDAISGTGTHGGGGGGATGLYRGATPVVVGGGGGGGGGHLAGTFGNGFGGGAGGYPNGANALPENGPLSARGGTQSAGGTSSLAGGAGSSGTGGNASSADPNPAGGGGGGGYFGGGAGKPDATNSGGGGGGSSFTSGNSTGLTVGVTPFLQRPLLTIIWSSGG